MPPDQSPSLDLLQQCRDCFNLQLGQSTGHGDVVGGFDHDHDTNLGVEDRYAFGTVVPLEAPIEGSIRIGVH
jgi:hypothetical protein